MKYLQDFKEFFDSSVVS